MRIRVDIGWQDIALGERLNWTRGVALTITASAPPDPIMNPNPPATTINFATNGQGTLIVTATRRDGTQFIKASQTSLNGSLGSFAIALSEFSDVINVGDVITLSTPVGFPGIFSAVSTAARNAPGGIGGNGGDGAQPDTNGADGTDFGVSGTGGAGGEGDVLAFDGGNGGKGAVGEFVYGNNPGQFTGMIEVWLDTLDD